MNNKKSAIASVALAVLFIGTVAIMTIDSAYATSKTTETTTQRNSCGNDALPLNIICQIIYAKANPGNVPHVIL